MPYDNKGKVRMVKKGTAKNPISGRLVKRTPPKARYRARRRTA